MKKENKLLLINAWLAKALKNAEKIYTQEYDKDREKNKEYENSELEEYEIDTIAGINTDVPVNEDENTDVVLQEIGYSSDEYDESEDDQGQEEEIYQTRAVRRATTYRSRQYFGDSG